MRNKPIRETELVQGFIEELGSRLPADWSADLQRYQSSASLLSDAGTDAVVLIAGPKGRPTGQVAVTVKAGRLTPKEALALASWAPTGRFEQVIVAAPYLSPRACELLASKDFGYFDQTGNLRISTKRPLVFIETAGAERDPWGAKRTLGSLKGQAAGRVIRALCDLKPPYGIRELGERAEIPAPTVGRVVELLEAEAFVEREPRGPVVRADPAPIIRRWVQDCGLTKSNRTASYLAPRGIPWLRERLVEWDGRYVTTASLAVPDELRVAPARLGVIYVDSFSEAAAALDLREVDAGTNVLLVESFGGIAMDRTRMMDGLRCASLSQTAADLLTSPGRGPSEGEELLDWMEGNEDAWRT